MGTKGRGVESKGIQGQRFSGRCPSYFNRKGEEIYGEHNGMVDDKRWGISELHTDIGCYG